MGSFNLDYFIHAANILMLAAYSVRDILWLRVFAVASSVIAIPYFLLQPTPLWAACGWSVVFTGTIQWNAELLQRYLDANPETRNLFQRHLARDLAGKLQQATTDVAESAVVHATASGRAAVR